MCIGEEAIADHARGRKQSVGVGRRAEAAIGRGEGQGGAPSGISWNGSNRLPGRDRAAGIVGAKAEWCPQTGGGTGAKSAASRSSALSFGLLHVHARQALLRGVLRLPAILFPSSD